MPPTQQELSLLIHPLVPESVQHNNRVSPPSRKPLQNLHTDFFFFFFCQVLSQLRSLTAFLLGISAGILGLQSASGFAFYSLGTLLVSALVQFLVIGTSGATAGAFFPGSSGGEVDGIDATGKIRGSSRGHGKGKAIERKGAWRDVVFGGGVMSEALSGFILGWAGVGGVLR